MVDTGTDARKKGWAGRQCTVSSSAITIAIVLSGRKSFALGLKGDPAGWEGLTRPPYPLQPEAALFVWLWSVRWVCLVHRTLSPV